MIDWDHYDRRLLMMHGAGLSVSEIRQELGFAATTVRNRLQVLLTGDSSQRAYGRKRRKKEAEVGYRCGKVDNPPISEEEYRRRRDAIPEDTRDFTRYFFGDPLPGRSALDQERMAR